MDRKTSTRPRSARVHRGRNATALMLDVLMTGACALAATLAIVAAAAAPLA